MGMGEGPRGEEVGLKTWRSADCCSWLQSVVPYALAVLHIRTGTERGHDWRH